MTDSVVGVGFDRQAASLDGHRMAVLIHATVFAAVNVMLFVIWAATGAGFAWFLFPLFGWGIGLAVHGVVYRLKSDHYWEGVARMRAGWPG
jgi:hypothetical protein